MHTNTTFFYAFIIHTIMSVFLYFRQVQHLRDTEGAECQEHDYHSPGGPALLGTGFYVVSYLNIKY